MTRRRRRRTRRGVRKAAFPLVLVPVVFYRAVVNNVAASPSPLAPLSRAREGETRGASSRARSRASVPSLDGRPGARRLRAALARARRLSPRVVVLFPDRPHRAAPVVVVGGRFPPRAAPRSIRRHGPAPRDLCGSGGGSARSRGELEEVRGGARRARRRRRGFLIIIPLRPLGRRVVAATPAGAFFASACIAPLASDRLGRRGALLIVASTAYVLGAIAMALAGAIAIAPRT